MRPEAEHGSCSVFRLRNMIVTEMRQVRDVNEQTLQCEQTYRAATAPE